MTPPNELEQLAQFQDAIQSDKGLERLRAMQYLQQMNNQGIMGLPQVTQQPVVQRGNGGTTEPKLSAFAGLGHTVDNIRENLTTEDLSAALAVGARGGSNDDRLIAQQIIGIFRQSDPELVDEMFQAEQDEIDYEESEARREMIEGVQDKIGGGLENIQEYLGARTGRAHGGPIIERFNGGLTNLRGAEGLKETVNYMEEGTIQEANAMAMAENQPSFIFQNQLYETGTMTPIRENTEKGIRERATLGGVVETPNMFRGYGPRYQGGLGGKITDTWGSNEPPQPVNLPIQSQDVTNTFMNNATPDGSLGPMSPRMVEYTPPFYGGMLIPPGGNKPIMVPADEQGNPIMPLSKQAMTAAQGGYVLDLAGGGSIANAAQGLADFGRYGDNMLVHMNPDEVAGLMSLGNLTINPVTGLPEAFSIGNFFKPIRKIASAITKPIRKVVKSKAFKALAPLVLAVAAPYALGALAPSVFGAGATALGGALSTSGALGYGLATGLGSMAGNLLGGARFGDAARQGLMSGATGGLFKGLGSGNWMGTGNPAAVANAGKLTQVGRGAENIQAGTQVAKAPVTGGNPFAAAQQSQQAAQQAAQASKIGSNILTTPGGIEAYTGTGLQPTITAEGVPTNIAQNLSTPEFSNIQFTTEGVPSAPEATRTGFFGKGPLSNTGGTLGGEGYTGSTFDKIKQVGKNIYTDYANPRGVAKLVGMDLMQPNWDEVYASEEAMENQLADMGYTIDTGFDGQKVIRDSSGTVMPSNLTTKELLDRALGRTPRTRLADRIGFEPNASQFAAQGGLVSLAHGGEFSGKVEGDGHGMEDNVYMPIVEKGQGQQIGTLAVSPSEYVVDAHTMSALGNGNADEGAKVMDSVIAGVRKKAFGTTQQPKEIDGLNALMPMMERA